MENEKKTFIERLRNICVEDIMFVVLVAYIGFLCCQSYAAIGNRGNVDAGISAVEKQQQSIGAEVGRTGTAIKQAETAIGAANGGFKEIQGCIVGGAAAAGRITNGVIDCERIIDQCRNLAGDNERILAGVEARYRSGAETTGTANG